jgi:LemA protein
MMPAFITIIAICVSLVLWGIFIQRKLVVLDENVNNAMNQIGAQLSNRFDALLALLNITKAYDACEIETLTQAIKSGRSLITAISTPDDVLRQEEIIFEALCRLAIATRQYPELTADENFIKAMNAVETYENMVRTSRLIYNDSVAKLNREIRMIPVSIIAGVLGFRQREYLSETARTDTLPAKCGSK